MAAMQALVRRIGGTGTGLVGKSDSCHWVAMDTSAAGGGLGAASSPLELVLIALGGCTSMDVLSILAKKRIKLDDYEVLLEAGRAETTPRAFTAIRVLFRFYGENLVHQDLEQAVQLSYEKYCSVATMLRTAVPIEVKFEAHPPRPVR